MINICVNAILKSTDSPEGRGASFRSLKILFKSSLFNKLQGACDFGNSRAFGADPSSRNRTNPEGPRVYSTPLGLSTRKCTVPGSDRVSQGVADCPIEWQTAPEGDGLSQGVMGCPREWPTRSFWVCKNMSLSISESSLDAYLPLFFHVQEITCWKWTDHSTQNQTYFFSTCQAGIWLQLTIHFHFQDNTLLCNEKPHLWEKWKSDLNFQRGSKRIEEKKKDNRTLTLDKWMG